MILVSVVLSPTVSYDTLFVESLSWVQCVSVSLLKFVFSCVRGEYQKMEVMSTTVNYVGPNVEDCVREV